MNRMATDFAKDLELAYGPDGNIELRATNITEGGLLDEVGLTRDDTIHSINGVAIHDANGGPRLLRDLAQCQPVTALVSGPGGTRSIEITAEMLSRQGCTE